MGDRVHRDQVDVAQVAAEQVGQRVGVGRGVVDPVDHRQLVGDPPAGRPGVVAGRRHDLGHRPAPVERTSTSRSGSRAAWRLTARVNWARARSAAGSPGRPRSCCTVMCRAPSPKRRGSDRAVTASRTRSRLSSGSPMPMNTTLVSRGRRPRAGRPRTDLVDDLGRLEVAAEAELTGRTERAADRAAGLARDAHRVPLAGPAAGRVMHQDRLDERAVRQPVERLLGQAAVGRRALGRPRVSSRKAASSCARSAPGSVRISRPTRRRSPSPRSRRRPGARGRPVRRAPRARPGGRRDRARTTRAADRAAGRRPRGGRPGRRRSERRSRGHCRSLRADSALSGPSIRPGRGRAAQELGPAIRRPPDGGPPRG